MFCAGHAVSPIPGGSSCAVPGAVRSGTEHIRLHLRRRFLWFLLNEARRSSREGGGSAMRRTVGARDGADELQGWDLLRVWRIADPPPSRHL